MYEVIKNIPANTELIVHYLPERPEEIFFMPAVHYLRNTLYRRTMDTILEGKSLDYNSYYSHYHYTIVVVCNAEIEFSAIGIHSTIRHRACLLGQAHADDGR